jgi:hypothetical protein
MKHGAQYIVTKCLKVGIVDYLHIVHTVPALSVVHIQHTHAQTKKRNMRY